MGVYVSGRISGGHINPAVTLGLAVIGKFPWHDVPKYLAAQFLGAFLGAIVVWLAYLAHWPVTEDQGKKLAVFCTGAGHSLAFPRMCSRKSSPRLS